MRAGIRGRRGAGRALVAGLVAGVVAAAMSVIPAGAHVYVGEGSTTVTPASGPPGTNVTVSAAGLSVEGNSNYGLLYADPRHIRSFEGSPAKSKHGTGENNVCGHGRPLAGPFTPDDGGSIGPVEIEIPFWSSSGRALLCFSNGSRVTKPVAFEVTGEAADGGGSGGGSGGGFPEFCGPFAEFCTLPVFPSLDRISTGPGEAREVAEVLSR